MRSWVFGLLAGIAFGFLAFAIAADLETACAIRRCW